MTTIERSRLAQELHDGIAQDLVAVGYSLDLLLAATQTPLETRAQLRTLRFTVTEMIDKVRREIHQLHQPQDEDLQTQIRRMAEDLCKGLVLNYSIQEVSVPLDTDLTYHLGRIAQEILRNIASHAEATSAWISLTLKEGVLELAITDDGIGGASVTPEHYGIKGIRSRAESLGGKLTISSTTSGSKMNLTIPIN